MEKQIIGKVRIGGRSDVKIVTIPKKCDIKVGDFVKIELLSFSKSNETLSSLQN